MLSKRPLIASIVLLVIGLAFGATLVTGFGSWKGINLAFGASDPQLGGQLPNLPNDVTLQSINHSFVAIAKAVQPTVVSITVKTEAPKPTAKNQNDNNPFRHFFESPFGGEDGGSQFGQQGPEEGLGSGVIITSDGYILTNNHVVENAAKKGGVSIKLTDKRVFDARVVGTDPTTDLAVVKIDATNLPVAALGNSDEAQVGEMVMAVGNPLALESTVTKGIISSLGRAISIFDRTKTQNYGIANFIQTDAAINPGNSGGGLFDMHGAVIGINAAIASQTGMFAGYGFAIPINMAKAVAMDLIKTGKVNRGYIGVEIRAIDQTDAEVLGLDRPRGVRVDRVTKNGAGEEAGIKQNDIILSVDGREVNEANQLQGMIGMHHAGDQVSLKVWRDGKEIDKVVKLKPRTDMGLANNETMTPDESDNARSNIQKETATVDNIGLTIRNLTAAEKTKYGVKDGVIVTHVDQFSEAYDRGLGNNFKVITNLAHSSVKNVNDFEKIVDQNKGKAVGLTVYDDQGDSHFISIKIPG
jgi:serine protease Do